MVPTRFEIGLRTALFLAIMASVLTCGVLVHLTWWNTANAVSRNLLDSLGTQVADSARRAWWTRVQEVENLTRSTRDALFLAHSPADRERLLLSAARASDNVSWLVHLASDGEETVFEVPPSGKASVVPAAEDAASAGARPGAVIRRVALGAEWWARAGALPEPAWLDVGGDAAGAMAQGVAYVSRTEQGVLAAVIENKHFAALLGQIPVGHTGRSFILARDGSIVISAQPASEPAILPPGQPGRDLAPVAREAGRRIAARPPDRVNIAEKDRFVVAGEGYAVGLSPMWFRGWQLAIILPESDFLGDIDRMIARVALGLAAFVVVAGTLGSLASRHMVAEPIRAIVGDLASVERFDLEGIPRRRSRLGELDRLSDAIVRMSAGLADFAKFIPTDLVRSLLRDGMRAEPGGARRELTVLFADLAGFTRLSEQLGDGVVPIVSGFLDLASRAVSTEEGTVDKFIGDAIMAFWGAPRPNDAQALHACRAALAIRDQFAALRASDPRFAELHVRIGLQSGPAIVGNVGSASRLNYTALGDTVNLASRLEGVNKIYGTTILLGPATAAAVKDFAILREIDTVAVYGRAGGIAVFELIAMRDAAGAPSAAPGWVAAYQEGLARYRSGDFAGALAAVQTVIALEPDDGPALRLAELCRALIGAPPPPDWQPVTGLDMK